MPSYYTIEQTNLLTDEFDYPDYAYDHVEGDKYWYVDDEDPAYTFYLKGTGLTFSNGVLTGGVVTEAMEYLNGTTNSAYTLNVNVSVSEWLSAFHTGQWYNFYTSVFSGNDRLEAGFSGTGGNVIAGFAGDDTIIGAAAGDSLYGFEGNDSIYGGGGAELINGNAGNDTAYGEDGADYVYGGRGDDVLNGNADADTLNGNLGNDTVSGDAGNDRVHGGQDADSISGGDGSDSLFGDRGNDTLTGGSGADYFVFRSDGGADLVTDYTDGTDKIMFISNINTSGITTTTDVLSHITSSGGNAVIDFGSGNTVTLVGVSSSALDAGDFLVG